ncbi:hypothetical protein NL676_031010 [Syzygium grande]|nr:hypothetical protein NL676_031010 [Syzygium grande]
MSNPARVWYELRHYNISRRFPLVHRVLARLESSSVGKCTLYWRRNGGKRTYVAAVFFGFAALFVRALSDPSPAPSPDPVKSSTEIRESGGVSLAGSGSCGRRKALTWPLSEGQGSALPTRRSFTSTPPSLSSLHVPCEALMEPRALALVGRSSGCLPGRQPLRV